MYTVNLNNSAVCDIVRTNWVTLKNWEECVSALIHCVNNLDIFLNIITILSIPTNDPDRGYRISWLCTLDMKLFFSIEIAYIKFFF